MQYCDIMCAILYYLHDRLFSVKLIVLSPCDFEWSCKFLLLSILAKFKSARI